MRLSEIKTRDQFNEVSDAQYQRTKSLWIAATNGDKPDYYRAKAFYLWLTMMKRVQKLIIVACKIQTTKHKDFPKGGFSSTSQIDSHEYVILNQ
jgi:hypothetical protein